MSNYKPSKAICITKSTKKIFKKIYIYIKIIKEAARNNKYYFITIFFSF